MVDPISIGILAGSIALSIYGKHKAAKAQKEALEAKARAAREQAAELVRRSELNIDKMRRQEISILGQQAVGFASRGVSLESGVALDTFADTLDIVNKNIENMRAEVSYQADLMTSEAGLYDSMTSQISSAAFLERLTELFNVGYKGYTAFGNTPSTTPKTTAP